jgi:hypothetical protein
MSQYRIPRGLGWAIAAACLASLMSTATAGSFTRGCAARDLQLSKLIEESEEANAVSAQKTTDAMMTMMYARIVCHEGRVVDALVLYDGVSEMMAGSSLLSER